MRTITSLAIIIMLVSCKPGSKDKEQNMVSPFSSSDINKRVEALMANMSIEEKSAAIVQEWFPGEEGLNALADIIVGHVNPTAKLCVTYPKTGDKQEVNYKNGYSGEKQPQYPFGYGLSYTTYDYSDMTSPASARIKDERISLSCKIKNTGELAGTKIVQLYISPKDSDSGMKPIQLKGFQRVALEAGEEKNITFKVSPEQLVQYNDGLWIIESGSYEFMIAASSTDIRLSETIEIEGDRLVLENGRSIFFSLNE